LTIKKASVVFVLHSPYPDGSWRGEEKCAMNEKGEILQFNTQNEAMQYSPEYGEYFTPWQIQQKNGMLIFPEIRSLKP